MKALHCALLVQKVQQDAALVAPPCALKSHRAVKEEENHMKITDNKFFKKSHYQISEEIQEIEKAMIMKNEPFNKSTSFLYL